MNNPKLTGIEIRKFDWYGWIMSIIGLICIGYFAMNREWIFLLLSILCFWDFVVRVSFGRIYKLVYLDTILFPMFELQVDSEDKPYYVCAQNEEELATYMDLQYPGIKYKILNETHVESYIKVEEFQ